MFTGRTKYWGNRTKWGLRIEGQSAPYVFGTWEQIRRLKLANEKAGVRAFISGPYNDAT